MYRLNTSGRLSVLMIGALCAVGPALYAEPQSEPSERDAAATMNEPAALVEVAPSEETTSPSGEKKPDTEPDVSDGLWPSRKLLRLALTRLVDQTCDRYDMDEDRRKAIEEEIVGQWEEYLSEHRRQLQPLLNEFLEMRLGLDPPGEDRVREWADRAAPALEEMRVQVEQSWARYREALEPLQRAKFEAEVLAARAGLGYAEARLSRWREGSFELSEVWEPRDRDERTEARNERRERRDQRRGEIKDETEAAAPGEVEKELDRWDQHVAEFVARYQLDGGQRSAALSVLAEMKQRAMDHRDRYRDDIRELEGRIKDANENAEEREAIKKELVRLYGPIDELFGELERRLEPIPTKRQRELAESRENRKTDQSKERDANGPGQGRADSEPEKDRKSEEQDPNP